MARSVQECGLAICMEDITPFRPNAQAELSFNSLRMDMKIAHSELFRGHERLESKSLSLDLMVSTPARPRAETNKYQDTFLATYTSFCQLYRCTGPWTRMRKP